MRSPSKVVGEHRLKKKAIIVFTRVPIEGKTKTRLMSEYTAKEAAALHHFFITCILSAIEPLRAQLDGYLFYTPAGEKSKLTALIDEENPQQEAYWHFVVQQGETLWQKMEYAFSYCFDRGYERVILVGTDIPQMNTADIRQAIAALDSNDMVFLPTEDGGYCLIGMNRKISQVFSISDQSNVLEASIRAVESIASYELLEEKRDIDTPQDLEELIQEWEEGGEECKKNLETILNIIKRR